LKKKNYKKRVSKRKVNKCIGICCTYCDLQYRYADLLATDDNVESFEVNVPILDEEYTTDFLIKYTNGKIKAFECVEREHMLRPSNSELLNKSKSEWYAKGIEWGIICDRE